MAPSPAPPQGVTALAATGPSLAPSSGRGACGAEAAGGFDIDSPWALHRDVALRSESFGALAYHFGNRKLSFLKSPMLVRVVKALASSTSGREACRAAGVPEAETASYEGALRALARSEMIVARPR